MVALSQVRVSEAVPGLRGVRRVVSVSFRSTRRTRLINGWR